MVNVKNIHQVGLETCAISRCARRTARMEDFVVVQVSVAARAKLGMRKNKTAREQMVRFIGMLPVRVFTNNCE